MKKHARSAWVIWAGILVVSGMAGCGSEPEPVPEPEAVLEPERGGEEDVPAEVSPVTVAFQMPGTYVPGEPVAAVVAMDYAGAEPVTALALRLLLPAGWQFAGVSGDLRPAIEPPAGAQDEITFVWIQIPAFPATFECMLEPPTDSPGESQLSAQAVFRRLAEEEQSRAVSIMLDAEAQAN